MGFRGVAEAEVSGVYGLKSVGRGCVSGGAWIKAPAQIARRRPAQRAADPRCAPRGWMRNGTFSCRPLGGATRGAAAAQVELRGKSLLFITSEVDSDFYSGFCLSHSRYSFTE